MSAVTETRSHNLDVPHPSLSRVSDGADCHDTDAGVRVVVTRPTCNVLDRLTDTFAVVATRATRAPGWTWAIPDHEVSFFHHQRDHRAVITAQEKVQGGWALLAKLAKPAGRGKR
jgi:hypothetical protein